MNSDNLDYQGGPMSLSQEVDNAVSTNDLQHAAADDAWPIRNNWRISEVDALFAQPFSDLLHTAQQVHRQNFDPNEVQVSTLLSIKTGACPEDCKYCSQSGHYNTGLEKEKLMQVEQVIQEAKVAKEAGATRFCMGAAWRSPREKDLPLVLDMVRQVKALGLETCMTLGMLTQDQSAQLSEAGLDYYNHNLDTSPEHYNTIITTRSFQDRLDTLHHVREAGMKVCSGGILGMGESRRDRMSLLVQLANLPVHPESVPINQLVKIEGTPLENVEALDPIEFVKMIAVARIMMPQSRVRLSAGRDEMNESTQALCFLAGANSIFYGEQLLTTPNPDAHSDKMLFQKLGINTASVDSAEALGQKRSTFNSNANATLYYDAMASR